MAAAMAVTENKSQSVQVPSSTRPRTAYLAGAIPHSDDPTLSRDEGVGMADIEKGAIGDVIKYFMDVYICIHIHTYIYIHIYIY